MNRLPHPLPLLIVYLGYAVAVMTVAVAQPVRLGLLAIPPAVLLALHPRRLRQSARSFLHLFPLLVFLAVMFAIVPGSSRKPYYALLLTGKAVLILAATRLLPAFTSLAAMISFLHDCRLPRPMLGVLYFGLRYLGLADAEVARFGRAVRTRSAGPLPWRTRLGLVRPALHRFFWRALDRSSSIHAAMLCRGYSGRIHFPPGRPPAFTEWAVAAVSVLLFLGVARW